LQGSGIDADDSFFRNHDRYWLNQFVTEQFIGFRLAVSAGMNDIPGVGKVSRLAHLGGNNLHDTDKSRGRQAPGD
jgi:hypothetical protein